ncbi:hypothetical protein EDF56_101187 [Novosphingobium sp. PhB165]|uniref:hypothetical protein n=1 Tax=Novosphingobium sp. PhB165 TaxID=2485105 RepID=UPI00104FF5F1|nr:hypothetical protein [Novosphingobium sp. PhB165]TCM21523.1 hypothetical protein EDF56_101187 [Novosphingobium sp. PhB165]
MSTTSDIAAGDDRTTAQFFFDVGYFAAWSDAYMQNGKKAAFTISDGDLDRAWAIAPEAHDDREEWDRHMAATQPGWQPIETAPKDAPFGTWIIGCRAGQPESVGPVTWRNGFWFQTDGERWIENWLTHWMPLPSAPSQIEEGKDNG